MMQMRKGLAQSVGGAHAPTIGDLRSATSGLCGAARLPGPEGPAYSRVRPRSERDRHLAKTGAEIADQARVLTVVVAKFIGDTLVTRLQGR